jgi:hypothetical protein
MEVTPQHASIELERAGVVATLWLNRRARRNAFDLAI